MLLVFSTLPNEVKAREIVGQLVDERLAACGNILPSIRSIYRWKDEVHEDVEVLVLFKVSRPAYPELQRRLRELHPYELPEIVAVAVDAALPEYLGWVAANSHGPI